MSERKVNVQKFSEGKCPKCQEKLDGPVIPGYRCPECAWGPKDGCPKCHSAQADWITGVACGWKCGSVYWYVKQLIRQSGDCRAKELTAENARLTPIVEAADAWRKARKESFQCLCNPEDDMQKKTELCAALNVAIDTLVELLEKESL